MTQIKLPNQRLTEWLRQLKVPEIKLDQLLIGSALSAVIGLILTQPKVAPPSSELDSSRFCQQIVQPKAAVTRQQLTQLMTVPERSERSQVQNLLNDPYCVMPSLSIRAGATTERDAYPLLFDGQTWLVVLYEGGTYVGYGFKRS